MGTLDKINLDELAELGKRDLDAFIDKVIEIFTEMPDAELKDAYISNERKIDAILNMQDYLIKQEHYEKCAKLKKVIDRLRES